jgi:hypothetical protein
MAAAVMAVLASAAWVRGDVFVLVNGDRITGKSLSEGKRTFRIQTPYGRLAVPRAKIARIERADGSEVMINAPTVPSPSPTPSPAQLVLQITGKSFWHAWSKGDAERADTALRLQVSLDEEHLATYVDQGVDDQEIKGALVNTFTFAPEELKTAPASSATVLAPETRPGRIVLKIALPPEQTGTRRLRLAYQINEGTVQEPAWRELASADTEIRIGGRDQVLVDVQQNAGAVEFSGFPRRRMKNVDTFQITLRAE